MPVAVSPAVRMLIRLVILKGRASKKPGNWTSILNPGEGIRRVRANARSTEEVSKPIRLVSGIKWS
jgi:hypothetical protein